MVESHGEYSMLNTYDYDTLCKCKRYIIINYENYTYDFAEMIDKYCQFILITLTKILITLMNNYMNI